MTGPTLIATYYGPPTGDNTNPLVTPSFTPSNGEVIVIKARTWDTGTAMLAPSGGGQTYSAYTIEAPGGFNGWVGISTAVISGSPGSMTITASPAAHCGHAWLVERWTGQLAGTPATGTGTGGPGSTPTSTIITVGTNSAVSFLIFDARNVDPSTRVYASGATEEQLDDGHAAFNGVTYFAWQAAASPGSQTFGLTAPTTLGWVSAAVEIEALGGGAIVDMAAALTATGSLTDALIREAPLAAGLTATGGLSAALVRELRLAAALTGTGSLSVGLTREQALAAALTATGSLSAALTRQVGFSAALTATGSMADALTREVGLAAALAGNATMAASMMDEAHLSAAFTATGSMSATLSGGAQTVTLSANFTATAGMTAVFSIPTVGPTDPIATPVAEKLMACFMEELATLPEPPRYVQIRVGQETGPLIGGPDGQIDECCAGLAWIRVANVYPSWDSFPAADNTWTPCGPFAYAVVLEMGISFCMPWSSSEGGYDNLDPPSSDDWATAFNTQMVHQNLMRRTAACCFPATQRRAVGEWTPLPVEGGCTGGKLMLTVSVMNPCSDC